MNKSFKVIGLFIGKIGKLSNGVESAIHNNLQEQIILKKDGIVGDQVADKKYHGGEMRVLHHYSQKNYQHLKSTFPEIADHFVPGSFGENLLTEELTEQELNIGDIYSLGTAKIQLTVCRRPCATLNYGYKNDRVLKEIIRTGKTGWFYRILEEGIVKLGDELSLIERPFENLPILKLHEQGYGTERFSDREFLKRCWETGLLDKGWKPKLEALFK
ncbi:MAG: MOSC domain-containing protein [Bdellovibrio sp.]